MSNKCTSNTLFTLFETFGNLGLLGVCPRRGFSQCISPASNHACAVRHCCKADETKSGIPIAMNIAREKEKETNGIAPKAI
eukprot:3798212-Amphidinium_carterae.1